MVSSRLDLYFGWQMSEIIVLGLSRLVKRIKLLLKTDSQVVVGTTLDIDSTRHLRRGLLVFAFFISLLNLWWSLRLYRLNDDPLGVTS